MKSNRKNRLLLAAISLTLTAPSAFAAALTWDTTSGDGATITPGSGNWNVTAGNTVWNNGTSNVAWSQAAVNDGSNTATFAGTDGTLNQYVITLATQMAAESITFNNSGYQITGSTLAIMPTTTTNGNITVAANKTATINSAILFANNAATTITSNSNSTLNLGGGATNSQYTFTGAGTINMTSGTYTANVGRVNVGTFNQTGGTFVMNLPSGTAATPDGYFIGDNAGRNVAYTMSGSSIINARASGTTVTNAFVGIGRASGTATNTVNVQGSANLNVGVTANTSGELWIASDNNSNGTLNVSGSSAVTVGTGKADNKIYFFRNGAGAGNSSNLTQSGGTVTANGIQFGGAAGTYDATSSANLTLSGGVLYVGLQGITRGAGAGALQSNIKLQGGVIGASDNWSSSLDMKLGTTSGGPTFQAATSGAVAKNITLSGILSDDTGVSGKLTKTGAGTLTLSGVNTYSGDTTINVGTLRLGASNVIADGVGKGNVSVASVATFDLSGFSETINGLSGAGTVDNTLSSSGATLTVGSNAGGTFSGTIKNTTSAFAVSLTKTGNTDLILSGTNTYNGATTIDQGRLFINSANSLSANTAVTVNGGSLVLNASGTPTFAQSITLANNSNLSARQAATVSNVTLATNGTLTFNQDDATTQALTVNNGTTALNGTLTVQVGGGAAAPAAVTLSGILSGGSGNLVKIGSGQLTLSGSNSFNGLTIKNGTLESRATTTTLGTGTVTMGGTGSTGATYITGQNNSNAFVINAPDSGTVTIGANGAGSGFTMSGGISLNGNLTLQTFNNTISGTTKAAAIFTGGISGTGNVLLNNDGLAANTITIATNAVNHTGTLTLQGTATGNTTISANIGSNVTSVTQNSATSRLILSGTNTYTGATTVSAGTLAVNGSLANTSTTVGTGGTLQGSGSMGGSVTVQSGGKIAAGNSIESLATGALSLLAGSTFAYEMNNDAAAGVAGDLTAVTGSMTFDVGNAALLTLTELGTGSWSNGDKLTLLSYSGAWNGGLFNYASSTLADDSTFTFSGMEWAFNYNDTVAGTNYTGDLTGSSFVTMTAIPEPNAAALVGGLGALALLRRRRN